MTSNGKVLATVSSPVDEKQAARERLQAIAGCARIGDIVSPRDEEWEVQA